MLIQLGLNDKKYLFILVFPIFGIITGTNRNPYYKSFNEFLSLACCGFIHSIIKYMIKPENKNQTIELQKSDLLDSTNTVEHISKSNDNNSIYAQIYKKLIEEDKEKIKLQNKNNILFILLISIIQLIASLTKNIFKQYIKRYFLYNLPILLDSIFLIIFSMIFLGFSLYNHQYLSLTIILICIIIFFIGSLFYETDLTVINAFQSFIITYFYNKIYCLSYVLGKKYLNTYMDDVYLFLFKICITGTISLLIYDIIAYFCKLDIKYHGIIQTNFENFEIWVFLVDLLLNILYEIGLWLTIYYFSPCHFIIYGTLRDFLIFYFSFFDINDILYNNTDINDIIGLIITYFVIYLIISFALLVFNEIIILNFCGLNKNNTKIYIMKRELADDKESYYSRNNTSKSELFDLDDTNRNV